MFVKPGFQTDDDKSSRCYDRLSLGTKRGCLRDALHRIGDVAVRFAEVFAIRADLLIIATAATSTQMKITKALPRN